MKKLIAVLFLLFVQVAYVVPSQAEGLLTDGIVGPATWIRLADRLNLPQPSLAG